MARPEFDTPRFKQGLAVRRDVLGAEYVDKSVAAADDFTAPFQKLLTEWCWGDTWTRPGLDRKTRSMLNLAMLTALNRPHEIKLHVRGALEGAIVVASDASLDGELKDDLQTLGSLAALGVAPGDVDVIVLSHLHFDHAGGLLLPWAEGQAPALAFPRARYVVGARAWARAKAPHARDRASFIPELPGLLEGTGRLEVVEDGASSTTLGEGYSFTLSDGHTPGLLLTRVESPWGPVTFMGDLVPGVPWVHLPITMGYDRYPELLIDEKTIFTIWRVKP